MTDPARERDYCPTCGAAYEPLQEYCLDCGTRLPTNRGVVGVLAAAWQRRFAWYPGDWIWPVLFFLALTILATTAAVAATTTRSSSSSRTLVATGNHVTVGPGAPSPTVAPSQSVTLPSAPQPTFTTGPLPTAPGSRTGPTPTPRKPAPNPNALAVWPSGKSGYTIILESLPVAQGRPNAVARARLAKRNGLKDVGVLLSSQYSSLHAGYYAIFQGIFQSQSQASAGVSTARAKGFPDAYQTRITR
jgi:hypothetical protein